jgi:glucose-6-phosphate isomerase
MTQAHFTQDLTHTGVSQDRANHWLETLAPLLPRIHQQPQREAKPVLDLPTKTDDLKDIEEIAKTVADHFDTLLVVGMGGSSLSGEALAYIHKPSRVKLKFLDNIDPKTIETLTNAMDWKNTAILVISKSGNTVETLAQMSVLLRKAKTVLGANVSKHFFVITIANDNSLHSIAKANGIRVLAHDPDLGGRFSILSSVGLIPAAAIGMDIRRLRAGAASVLNDNSSAVQAAAVHMALMDKNIRVNVMMHYCDRLAGLANWYRQCWGESLGKCTQATTPIRSRGTTDQHSQLQLYLDGPKDKLFTMMLLENQGQGELIDFDGSDDTRLDFMKGRTLGDLMVAQQKGTAATLINRGCPLRTFTMKELNEEVLGALLMHFALEIMYVAELMGVNAFDQPAVEDSKLQALQYLADLKKR